MSRSGLNSGFIRSAHNPEDFFILNQPSSRPRAVENDYFDKVPAPRPASAPFTCYHHSRPFDLSRQLSEGVRMDERCNSMGQTGVARPAKHRLPGTAKRLLPKASTTPTLSAPPVQRELKPANYSKSRREEEEKHFPTSPIPPPIPPPPSDEAAERLGLIPDSHIINRNPDLNKKPILDQPKFKRFVEDHRRSNEDHQENSEDQSHKKLLLVELDRGTAQTRCENKVKHEQKRTLISKSTVTSQSRQASDSDDHAVLEVEINKCKPGEHNYPCPRCGKCMCKYCKGHETRTRSQTLLCGGRCKCDVESAIEAATCFCIVRGCFYHCSHHDAEESCSAKPCSCREPNCCARWAVLGALTLLLPCLLCYPVARGCVMTCRECSHCARPGCRCKESNR